MKPRWLLVPRAVQWPHVQVPFQRVGGLHVDPEEISLLELTEVVSQKSEVFPLTSTTPY